jgi:hypothetical protein
MLLPRRGAPGAGKPLGDATKAACAGSPGDDALSKGLLALRSGGVQGRQKLHPPAALRNPCPRALAGRECKCVQILVRFALSVKHNTTLQVARGCRAPPWCTQAVSP